ncbi:hypothetical protein BDV98DRAFT_593635, partial [Pterulicium gracile]
GNNNRNRFWGGYYNRNRYGYRGNRYYVRDAASSAAAASGDNDRKDYGGGFRFGGFNDIKGVWGKGYPFGTGGDGNQGGKSSAAGAASS